MQRTKSKAKNQEPRIKTREKRMKKTILFLLCIIYFAKNILAEPTQPTYQIAQWFDDKKAAVSVNFDDNLPGQLSTALPILIAKGVKATFFVITNTASTQWADLQAAINAGNEVGSHSATHPLNLNPPALTPQQIETELKDSHDAILTNLTGQTSLCISWPFGKGGGGNDSVVRRIAKKYYFAARNTTAGTTYGDAYTHFQNSYFSTFGRNYYLQSGGVLMTSTTSKIDIGTCLTEIIKLNGWFSPYYHAVNQAGGYNNITTELFQQHIDTIAKRSNDVWITTVGRASKYHHERNAGAVSLVATAENATNWTLQLTDNLDNAVYDQPLTILLSIPGFGVETITQNQKLIPFTPVADIIRFNALPDGGDIVIKKFNTTATKEMINNNNVTLTANSDKFTVTVKVEMGTFGTIALYNVNGSIVKQVFNGIYQSDNQQFILPKSILPNGCLILKIRGKANATYKLLN